jgi:hypothetical protein
MGGAHTKEEENVDEDMTEEAKEEDEYTERRGGGRFVSTVA